jgi:hypothetical protein
MNNSAPHQQPKSQYDRRNEDDDLEEASQSTADYLQSIMPPKRKRERSFRWVGYVMAGLVVLAACGVAAYLAFLKPTSNDKPKTGVPQSTQNATSKKTITKSYSSPNFNLSFSYPADWTVAEAQDGSMLTVHSPPMLLKGANSQKITGEIVATIAHSGQNLTMFDAGNAVAVRQSEKIAYLKPSQTQRANTYLSFLQYAATTANGALDSIDITGDYGYQTGQAIPKTDIAKVDPLITITFVRCSDSNCSAKTTPLSVAASAWSDKTFNAPIKTLLQSLAIN